MLCKHPYVRDPTGKVLLMSKLGFTASNGLSGTELALSGVPFPCGQCLPCRINRRRVWTLRLMLEGLNHAESSFVTLTYAPEFLPDNGSLIKKHVQGFLKRLRKSLEPQKIRYFACGEYGEISQRPHYHLIIFGLPPHMEQFITRAWTFGLVHVGSFSMDSAQYVAGYVTKKIVKRGTDDERISEFVLCSRRPGLGSYALDDIVRVFATPTLRQYIEVKGDIPTSLKVGGKMFPLGRFMSSKLREALEINSDKAVDTYVGSVCNTYIENVLRDKKALTLVEFLIDESEQRNKQIEWKHKAFKKRQAI